MTFKRLDQVESTSLNSYSDWQYTKAIVDNYLDKCDRVMKSSDEAEMRAFLEVLNEAHSKEKGAYKKYTDAINEWNKMFLGNPNLLTDAPMGDIVFPS